MSTMTSNEHELIPLRVVKQLTGWNEQYVEKLRKSKVLRVFQPLPNLRPLYYRSQIVEMQRLPSEQKEQQQQQTNQRKVAK